MTLLSTLALAWSAQAIALDRCDALQTLQLPAVAILSATTLDGDASIDATPGRTPSRLGTPVCRVRAIARPTADSEIHFEVWIPAGRSWNGNYLQLGNGGFAGRVPVADLIEGVRRGYAVAGTDDGHESADGADAKWALGHPEKVRDFGYRALKVTHDAALRITATYAGSKVRTAYFKGCSDGGREALMVAQRYPEDFTGVLAGAPAADWTALMEGAAALSRRQQDPKARIPKSKLPILQSAALAACDGSAGYIADPARCRFNPDALLCRAQDSDACLTAPQLATAHAIYDGLAPRDSAREPWSGTAPGAEAAPGAWTDWLTGGADDGRAHPASYQFAWNYFAYIVRGDPAFQFDSMDAEDLRRSRTHLAPILNATDPDLRRFRRHGGRLLQYHGWNDPAIPVDHSRRYYRSVAAKLGDPSDFYRLYLVPGMLHCGGGAGPSEVDWLRYLEDWVERGLAPGDIVATHGPWDSSPEVASQRLVPFEEP
jgi:feruloyl esterase